ncbi:MAG: F0F1 ATP synthase subunit delta [Micavibrio sp.]|nr:F0F1 ATP synthase subunit delta [Micavibrio sp.]
MEAKPNKQTAARKAAPYALAAFDLARDSMSIPDWQEKLEILSEVIKLPDLERILRDPRLSPEDLVKIMQPVCEKIGMNEEQHAFVNILIEEKSLSLAPWVFDGYVKERKKFEGITDVTIISAFELTPQQVDRLSSSISKKFNIKAEPQLKVDPELIGGVKIIVGDTVIDQSVKGSLERMKRHLGNNNPPPPAA